MDWGDVVVHVMTTEQREYYALEGVQAGSAERSASWVLHGWPTCSWACGLLQWRQLPAHQRSLPAPPAVADFYGAAEEVTLPFDQSEDGAAVDSWTKKL